MNIHELAAALNSRAIEGGFQIAALPELRKRLLNKQKLPGHIFSQLTIFSGSHNYAFHHGGRDEMQFNVGEERIGNTSYTRFALCFSLEPSQSLAYPVRDLEPLRQRFNRCIQRFPSSTDGFEMWYYFNSDRHGNYIPQSIPDSWFQYGAFICVGSTIEKPLAELAANDVDTILNGFDRLLPIYSYVVLHDESLIAQCKIFTRLTSNDNNWELPNLHKWKKSDQGKKNVPFENQYGFGHEEWLLNQRYSESGFQYGYIRGLLKSRDSFFSEVHLYTVRQHRGQRLVYYVGWIRNVRNIQNDDKELQAITANLEVHRADMLEEVTTIGADVAGLADFPFQPNAKFKIEDVFFFAEPIYQPNFDLKKYKRFQPYILSVPIEEIFEGEIEDDGLLFVPGKASQKSIYNRKNKESSVTIEKMHTEIIEALEKYLAPAYSLAERNIAIETMRFKGNIADVVTQEDDRSLNIYEIKTSASGRRNIRDAISQLLDYALHAKGFKVNKIVIISPSFLKNDIEFLEHLRSHIGFPIEYFCYQREEKKFISQ